MGRHGLARTPLRRQYAGVLVGASLAGAGFAPVFGLAALIPSLLAVCLVGFALVELCRWRPAMAAWRPLLLAVGGLLTVVETVLFATTVLGVPTSATVRALGSGLSSWQQTLESTWPARAEPDLLLFVPLLVVVAGVLGVEVLDRLGGLPAMVPSLIVLGVGQAYAAVTGPAAYLLGFGYAVTAAVVLAPASIRKTAGVQRQTRRRAGRALPIGAVILVSAGVFGGLVTGPLDPVGRTPYTLQRAQPAELETRRTTNPLDEVAGRLTEPETAVFRYRTDASVDRWRLLALEGFDGSNWTTRSPFLRLGRVLAPSPAVQVPTSNHHAEIDLAEMPGPWLPSQLMLREVSQVGKTFVDPESGTLLTSNRPSRYTLSWYERDVTAQSLLTAAVDPDVPVGDLGSVPPEIAALANEAVAGKRATFQTALGLERYLANRYELATGSAAEPGPTAGNGWSQLSRFLLSEKRGTSEQFAAAYVVLARLNGIPARLAVGFRAPAASSPDGWTTVRNRDALVWPEVAIDGIGWWPLDPAGLADPHDPDRADRDRATEQARSKLPPPEEYVDDPPTPDEQSAPGGASDSGDDGRGGSRSVLAWLLVLPPAGWLVGTPLLRWVRGRRRRGRPAADAVLGAWAEARDRLRAHGVSVTAGMTVRDLAASAHGIAGDRTMDGLDRLARTVDEALWSSDPDTAGLTGRAWTEVRDVVHGLRERPWRSRLRAAFDVRSLLPP